MARGRKKVTEDESILTEDRKAVRKLFEKSYDMYNISVFLKTGVLSDTTPYFRDKGLKNKGLKKNDEGIHVFNLNDYIELFSKNVNFSIRIVERFYSLLKYIQFLLTDEAKEDNKNLINKTLRILNIDSTAVIHDNHSDLIDAIKIDRKNAKELIADKDLLFSLDFDISACNLYLNSVADYSNLPNCEGIMERLYKNKQKLAFLDYYFDCFCFIDNFSWDFIYTIVLGLFPLRDNENKTQRDSRIEQTINEIHEKICKILEMGKHAPLSYAVSIKLSFLLRLSNVTEKEYENILDIDRYTVGHTPTEILNSLKKKMEIYNEKYKETEANYPFKSVFSDFTGDVLDEKVYMKFIERENKIYENGGVSIPLELLLSNCIYDILGKEYCILFKLLVPLSLLSHTERGILREYLYANFNIRKEDVSPVTIPPIDKE